MNLRESANKQYIWIVEMLCNSGWKPTVGAGLTREEGRIELARWRSRMPDDDFRLVKYVRTFLYG